MFSDHNAVRLDLNYRRKAIKNSNTWRLNNMLLKTNKSKKSKKKLKYACIAMNLPLSTAFIVSHRICVFIFICFYAYFDFFFVFFCDLLVIQKHVVQPPYVGIFNSFSPVIEI